MKIHNPNDLPLIDYREVKPLQGNLKDLTEDNYNKLKNVLIKRGFEAPLFLWKNKESHYLMDGHQRQRVMLNEDLNDDGSYEVPYILIDAKDEKEAKAKLLEITSQYGTITQKGFDEFVVDLPEAEIYEAVHFDALPLLGQREDIEVEEDEVPEVSDEPPVSKLGEIYQLGRHRLMCGDSTKLESVEELMGGVLADMVFTDPPYNTGMAGESQGDSTLWRGKGKKDSARLSHMFNDSYSDEDFDVLLTDSIANMYAVTKSEAAFYVCIDWRKTHQVKGAIENMMPVSNVIVWDKMVHGLGSDYKYTYELIVVGKKGKPRINNRYGEDYQDIWHVQRKVGRNEDHATAKPVELVSKPITHASKQDDIVLDLFGGSGTTLIACEQLNRSAYMMELDPKYCDVIRKRYWKLVNDGNEEGWEENTGVIQVKENAVS